MTDCGVPPEDVRDHLVAHLDRLQREGVWGLEIKPASPVAESLEQLAAQAAGCTLCKLSEGRTNVVFGVGP